VPDEDIHPVVGEIGKGNAPWLLLPLRILVSDMHYRRMSRQFAMYTRSWTGFETPSVLTTVVRGDLKVTLMNG
jgi:hypothetical protein